MATQNVCFLRSFNKFFRVKRHLLLFFTYELAYSSTITTNPVHYEAMGLKKISLNLSGNVHSLDLLDSTSSSSSTAIPFHALMKACGVSNQSFSFDGTDFRGCYSIWAWDTTTSGSSANCPQVSTIDTSASYSISCEFGGNDGLGENIQMIVISELEKLLSVDQNSNWLLSG